MRMPFELPSLADLPGLFSRRRADEQLLASWRALAAIDQSRPLEEYDFVVVDTELTGLDPGEHEIVSIGAVRIRGMRIDQSDTFETLVRPERGLPRLSTIIHRITPEALKNAPPMREALPGFLSFAGSSLLVGHHVGMDMTFLSRAARRVFGGPLKNPCLDTLRLAQAYQEELFEGYYDQFNLQISYNLEDLTRQHRLPAFPAHDALQDALQTAYLFLFLCRKMRGGQVRTLKDLHAAGRTRRFL
jgi:DNA polymerase-3 subunit epsilon